MTIIGLLLGLLGAVAGIVVGAAGALFGVVVGLAGMLLPLAPFALVVLFLVLLLSPPASRARTTPGPQGH